METDMKQYSEVVIVGAGASGLLCGGMLAEGSIPVTILEKNKKVGKKLSASGNGRCNFTNLYMDPGCFYGDAGWLERMLHAYMPERIITQFRRIGICHRERDGYVYPHTNQAATVVDALLRYCRHGGAEVVTDCMVSAVTPQKEGEGYRISTSQGVICCRYLILATGGKASPELGGSGSGYKLARSLGHRIHKTYPALTGLVCGGQWNVVAGTRIQGRFSLSVDGTVIPGECGEIQVVKDGVSGIPVFQLCRTAAAALDEGRDVHGIIDFIPSMDRQELCQWIADHGIDGLVQKKWIPVLEKLLCGGKKRMEPWRVLKEYTFPVLETFGMERAQVTSGGVPTEEINVETMESKLAPDVFLTGELLDVDGRCGGYNLHFAWSCAMTAADELIRRKNGE